MRLAECCELVVTECAEQLKSVYTQMLSDPRLDPLMAGSRIQPCSVFTAVACRALWALQALSMQMMRQLIQLK